MTTQPSNKMHSPGLLDLPTELQLSIVQYLPFPYSHNLATTSRYFHSIIKRPTLSEIKAFTYDQSLHETRILLYYINESCEITPGPHKFMWMPYLACSYCVRLRPRCEFADCAPRWADYWVCLDCGLCPEGGKQGYAIGDELTVDYERHVWCKSCDYFTSDAGPAGSSTCAECFARDEQLLLPLMKRGKSWRRTAKKSRGKGSRKGDYDYEFEGIVGCLSRPREVWPIWNWERIYVQKYYLKNRSCWVPWSWNEGEKPILKTYPVFCHVYGDDVDVPFW